MFISDEKNDDEDESEDESEDIPEADESGDDPGEGDEETPEGITAAFPALLLLTAMADSAVVTVVVVALEDTDEDVEMVRSRVC